MVVDKLCKDRRRRAGKEGEGKIKYNNNEI
jgi:hypothetical protein